MSNRTEAYSRDFLADSRPDDMSPEDFYALLARVIERDKEVEAMRLYAVMDDE